jgi:A/G-specific adenine glycosylase
VGPAGLSAAGAAPPRDRDHGGRQARRRDPGDLDDLLALPGVGSYTARAVAAFAFGQRHPVVDTNVRRFVARAVGGLADAGPATTQRDLDVVEALLPATPADAARASIAFMELGAVVCVARSPRCGVCPVATSCAWRLAGSPASAVPAPRDPDLRRHRSAGARLLMAVLRDADVPVPAPALDAVWPDCRPSAPGPWPASWPTAWRSNRRRGTTPCPGTGA